MLIKSLRLLNFRQFKGTTNVAFSCNPKKNVTIILGDNTFGKTTLLQAFNWCLYGEATFDTNRDFLLNIEVANDMSNGDEVCVEAEICLVHDSTEYVVTRTQKYCCNNGETRGIRPQVRVSYKQPNGQTESVRATQVENVINNILPQDLSTYFFFDTERVRSISTRKDVGDAVKGLLGLTVIHNAIRHLGNKSAKTSVIGKFYSSMDFDGDMKAQEALNRIQTAEEKREMIAAQLEECASQIAHYETRKTQLEAVLREHHTTAQLQMKKEDLERRISEEKKAIDASTAAYTREYSQGSLMFFVQPLISKATEFLREAKIDDKGVKDLTRSTILDLINRGRCVCGQEIHEGSEAYNCLMDELAFVPPESIGNTVRRYREKLGSFDRSANRIYDSLSTRYQEILRCKTRVLEWREELENVSVQIKGKENMRQYEVELNDNKNRLRELTSKMERLIREDAVLKRDIDSYKKVYESLVGVSDKNKSTMLLIKYAEEITDWLLGTYKEKESVIRVSLESKVNEIFERMYHGHRRVVIDQQYQVSLLTAVADKEIETGESEGSNRVKNFAFIAGLVSLAKEKIISSKDERDFALSSEPYPLVMDAPFSNADETHTVNISRVLPEVAEQVIMFVMQKDWRYAERVMAHKVGNSYTLTKHSETYTELK